MARPARKLHLECRDGSWRVTVKVPADCRAIIGKANLIHTFGKIPYSKAAALHDEIHRLPHRPRHRRLDPLGKYVGYQLSNRRIIRGRGDDGAGLVAVARSSMEQ